MMYAGSCGSRWENQKVEVEQQDLELLGTKDQNVSLQNLAS